MSNQRSSAILGWVVGFMVACMILAGCSRDTAKSPDGGSVSDKEPVELTIYYFWSRSYEDFMALYGNDIVRKYPHFKINWIQNTKGNSPSELIASGINIDMYYSTVDNLAQLMDLGVDPDLSDLIKKYNTNLNEFEPTIVDYMQRIEPGKFVGIPFATQTLSLLYNKDIFDKFGIPYLSDGLTWDQLYTAARSLTRVDGGALYRGYAETWFPNQLALNQLSLPLIDSTTNRAIFDTDSWKKFLNNYIRFYQVPGYEPTPEILTGGAPATAFVRDQNIAITVRNNSDFPRKSAGANLNWDAATYPVFSAAASDAGPQPQVIFWTIPKNAKHREAAFLAATATASHDVQLKGSRNGLPSVLRDPGIREAFGADVPDLQGKNAKALIPKRYAAIIPPTRFNGIVTSAISDAYQKVVLGKTDLNSAFREAVEAADKQINATLGR
ncbi:ABC transporter substrate-binding protein [Paenibacillus ginsengarvi]|uniref:Extracellular solute-binding protein n=1 Tax=Paenibacillus ginsengarvi TaxID=400777 RepID=A0A3B0BEQ8_9BACL|nr:extracellular solute-binding protein [Paenibacillus ginsengarvi]RKN70557.1 extracellular solute-binding protein [Paenibacillus ginsengarvi]